VLKNLFLAKTATTVLMLVLVTAVVTVGIFTRAVSAQEQSRESMAVDATAAQWSYQFAGEGFWDYKKDHPEGRKGFLQFRLVAPISKSESIPFTMLPRLTVRYQQNAQEKWGWGTSDIFVLGIAQEWAQGRWGIGPQVNFPAQDGFGNKNWGLGLAGAVTQRELSDKLYLAVLLQQVWGKQGESDVATAAPIGINMILVYQLGNGWYIGNGDYVVNYSWDQNAWFIPFGVRLGKAFVGESSTWNAYIEYSTAVYYDDWPGPVPGHAFRLNVQYQVPVGF
jgi:hypothetical protein